jgi:hypothetical protein
MGKLDVGVGEEFPLDEQAKREGAADGPSCCEHGPNGHGSREEQREAWRRWRHHMRAEWHARRHAMREQFHREFAPDAEHEHHRHHMIGKIAVAGLALVGLAALFGHRHHD